MRTAAPIFKRPIRAGALVACLALALAGCSSPGASIRDPATRAALEQALAARSVNPGDPTKAAALVRAALDAQRYSLAFEEAQKLRELDPEGAEPLYLLGRACHGLGLFEEAIASYFASIQKTPTEDATFQLAWLLKAKGRNDLTLEILSDATRALPGIWRLEKLKSDVMPTLEDRVSVLEAFLAQNPGHAEASALLEALKPPTPVQHYLKITEGANEVIRTKLNDHYNLPLNIMGKEVFTQLTLSGRYLVLSEKAARDLGVAQTGMAGPPLSKDRPTEVTVIPRIQLGQLVLEYVPALIAFGGSRTEVTATLPMALLDGYVWKLDRKHEVLELYPPSQPAPPPSPTAKVQPYYDLNGQILTDAVLKNGIGKETLKSKVLLHTSIPYSLLNTETVREFDIGQLNTTRTTSRVRIAKKEQDAAKTVFVQNAQIHFGGASFLGDPKVAGFFSSDLNGTQYFSPHAWLGRDVLSRFILTIDPTHHTVALELY